MIYDVIIIGAGPAGLFVAANIKNKKVLIIEKNKPPGKKLKLSGAGQCNYTNNCEINELLQKYGDKGRFIKTALYNFTNQNTINFFKENGLDSIIREDNKVFPYSFKAADVLNVLIDCTKHAEILLNTSVDKVSYDENKKLFYIKTDTATYACHNLIISTGGKSYPNTGSTGDGYRFAESLGHSIVEPKPALTPVYVENYQFNELSGISFESIKISLFKNNKKTKEFTGDLLFTHVNISGPVIINNSRYMEAGDILKINFTSFINEDEFRIYFENLISSSKTNIKTALKELNLPKRLIEKVLQLCSVDENLSCSQLNKNSRKNLMELLSAYPMEIRNLGDYNIAMVTKGGVSTREINQKTMESKKIPRLYFAGEVVDYDGDTGGFNIQGAFSTAKLVADQVNKNSEKEL
ncbi:MAG: NAD(P)/FAD-dependent oxidoreductase [Tissierellia bacterium]|nr:NAD(P)/FAD-dependent oxidoreductase [Tissierellia bacterium]